MDKIDVIKIRVAIRHLNDKGARESADAVWDLLDEWQRLQAVAEEKLKGAMPRLAFADENRVNG